MSENAFCMTIHIHWTCACRYKVEAEGSPDRSVKNQGRIRCDKTQSECKRGCVRYRFPKVSVSACPDANTILEFPKVTVLGAQKLQSSIGARCRLVS